MASLLTRDILIGESVLAMHTLKLKWGRVRAESCLGNKMHLFKACVTGIKFLAALLVKHDKVGVKSVPSGTKRVDGGCEVIDCSYDALRGKL